MWPSVGVPEAPPETHSAPVGGSPERRFVLHVDAILTVRWVLMTVLCAHVSLRILEILWWSAGMSVTQTASVDPLNLVTAGSTGVSAHVVRGLAEKMQTVMLSTTELNVPAPQISLETHIPDVTLNVPATVTAPATKPVSG
jgi:hypothetical protein